jgi:hypothetical protein
MFLIGKLDRQRQPEDSKLTRNNGYRWRDPPSLLRFQRQDISMVIVTDLAI